MDCEFTNVWDGDWDDWNIVPNFNWWLKYKGVSRTHGTSEVYKSVLGMTAAEYKRRHGIKDTTAIYDLLPYPESKAILDEMKRLAASDEGWKALRDAEHRRIKAIFEQRRADREKQ